MWRFSSVIFENDGIHDNLEEFLVHSFLKKIASSTRLLKIYFFKIVDEMKLNKFFASLAPGCGKFFSVTS